MVAISSGFLAAATHHLPGYLQRWASTEHLLNWGMLPNQLNSEWPGGLPCNVLSAASFFPLCHQLENECLGECHNFCAFFWPAVPCKARRTAAACPSFCLHPTVTHPELCLCVCGRGGSTTQVVQLELQHSK